MAVLLVPPERGPLPRSKKALFFFFNLNSLFCIGLQPISSPLVGQLVKSLPAVQETRVQSLGQEDPWRRKWLPSILAWKILWTEEPGGLQSMGSQESDTAEQLNHHHIVSGEQWRDSAVRV